MASLWAGRRRFSSHTAVHDRQDDLILLMEDGRIVERGTHETLMAAGKEYAAMVERQMQQQREESGARAESAVVI